MLYILPPLRTQNPPAPWSNLICGNGNASTSIDRSWNNDNNKRPPRIQLRNIQIVKHEVRYFITFTYVDIIDVHKYLPFMYLLVINLVGCIDSYRNIVPSCPNISMGRRKEGEWPRMTMAIFYSDGMRKPTKQIVEIFDQLNQWRLTG